MALHRNYRASLFGCFRSDFPSENGIFVDALLAHQQCCCAGFSRSPKSAA
jgi:hypothetical protein